MIRNLNFPVLRDVLLTGVIITVSLISCQPGLDNYEKVEITKKINIDSLELSYDTPDKRLVTEKIFIKKGEFWKLWLNAHEKCMKSALFSNAIYFGLSNIYLGTLFDKSFTKLYNNLDYLNFSDEEKATFIKKSQGVPCDVTTSKAALDQMNITTPFASVLGTLGSDTKSTLAIKDWSIEELYYDPFKEILDVKLKTDKNVKIYYDRFTNKNTRYVYRVARISQFEATIQSIKLKGIDLSVDKIETLPGSGVKLRMSRIDSTTVRILSEGTFYMLGSAAKLRRKDTL